MLPATFQTPLAAVIAQLPRHATKIIERHRKQDRARIARIRDRFKETNELKELKAEALQRRDYLEGFDRSGKLYKERSEFDKDTGAKNTIRERDPALDNTIAEINEINARIGALQAETDPPCLTAGRIEALLGAVGPNARIAEFLVTPSLAKGESNADALARTRREIVAKREERAGIARKHRTKDEVLAAARAQIHEMAGRGQPKVRPLLDGGAVEFPTTKLPRSLGNFFNFVPDGAALVCWIMEAEILRKVEDLIDFNTNVENSLSQPDQVRQLAALDSELLELRREEAALVETIVAEKGNAWHFPDAPIEAVLSIAIN
jgi:hypothetical protein